MEEEANFETIQKQLKEGFGKVDKRLAKIDSTLEAVRSGVVGHDEKFEKLTEAINKKPDRDDFPQLLDKIFEYTTLKIEVEHLKKVVKEKLGVEI